MKYGLNIPASGALDFLSLGALIHRLDPGIIPFRKATHCDIHVSGGEFNCAANLSDCFRLNTGVATAMVDYPIGDLIAERVKAITKDKKLPVVYDAVGKSTWDGSLDCLQPRGLLAVFGNGSGPVAAFDLNLLAGKGSLYVTRPTLMTYTARREDLEAAAKELFDVVKSGKVKIETTAKYKLADAAQAHRDLEGRKTTGSVVLVP